SSSGAAASDTAPPGASSNARGAESAWVPPVAAAGAAGCPGCPCPHAARARAAAAAKAWRRKRVMGDAWTEEAPVYVQQGAAAQPELNGNVSRDSPRGRAIRLRAAAAGRSSTPP